MGQELNIDGLVGPSHNYSGLAYGNIASWKYRKQISNPRQAALQGLEKMKLMMSLGLSQAFFPPQERPYLPLLRSLGFEGKTEAEVVLSAYKQAPDLFYATCSASSMWAANVALVTPSTDSLDRSVHITPANLINQLHRAIETPFTEKILKMLFPNFSLFRHHPPLQPANELSDEGAANHTRLCNRFDQEGVHLFVYGRRGFGAQKAKTLKYPQRQTLEASEAIARSHLLPSNSVVFAQQNPLAIEAGVFHNDVISTGNQNLFFYHEQAFVDTERVIQELQKKLSQLISIKLEASRISLREAVNSYLFNSQIVTLADGVMKLIAPSECLENPSVNAYLEELVDDPANPIGAIDYLNLRESMQNGGGPACLRLRAVLSERELASLDHRFLLNETRLNELSTWINQYYRDHLVPEDLGDPLFYEEMKIALDRLTQILQLGPLYSFQK